MQHFNGNQLCAIDVETTGLETGWHEIWQLAIIPLTSDVLPDKKHLPLNILIRPENPERIDWKEDIMCRARKQLTKACVTGFDCEKAKGILLHWVDRLELPLTRGGTNRCRIIPLGHNFTYDYLFLKHWLGKELYEYLFFHQVRDTMRSATYLNDQAAMHAERVPFSKLTLRWVAKQLKVDFGPSQAHDALNDCRATAEVYRRLLLKSALG
jgi:DNA polymerase III epsilon subunit-like protein